MEGVACWLGETLCTDVVRQLAQGWGSHRFEQLPALELRGLTVLVPACRVVVPVGDVLGMPSTLAAEARFEFVGRERELAALRHAWDEAVGHGGGLVVVVGEPGVGKSRCCREFAHAVRSEGRSSSTAPAPNRPWLAFQPIVQALRHCVACVADPSTVLGAGTTHLARLVPEITARQPGIAGPPSTDFETARHLLFEAVVGWLAELGRHAPVLFVLDDLSWADSATLNLLRHAVAEIAGERVLVVATYRPPDATREARRFVHEHARTGTISELRVGGLGGDEPIEFAEGLLAGRLDAAARELVTTVSDTVGGNPLYLGEMIPHLSARAELERDGADGWTVRSDHDPLEVATAVGDVISDRIDRLGIITQRVLSVAVLGDRLVLLARPHHRSDRRRAAGGRGRPRRGRGGSARPAVRAQRPPGALRVRELHLPRPAVRRPTAGTTSRRTSSGRCGDRAHPRRPAGRVARVARCTSSSTATSKRTAGRRSSTCGPPVPRRTPVWPTTRPPRCTGERWTCRPHRAGRPAPPV